MKSKPLYRVNIEVNMNASHVIPVLIYASNERNAGKLAEKKVRKASNIKCYKN